MMKTLLRRRTRSDYMMVRGDTYQGGGEIPGNNVLFSWQRLTLKIFFIWDKPNLKIDEEDIAEKENRVGLYDGPWGHVPRRGIRTMARGIDNFGFLKHIGSIL